MVKWEVISRMKGKNESTLIMYLSAGNKWLESLHTTNILRNYSNALFCYYSYIAPRASVFLYSVV
jgi:hypothetical protein